MREAAEEHDGVEVGLAEGLAFRLESGDLPVRERYRE